MICGSSTVVVGESRCLLAVNVEMDTGDEAPSVLKGKAQPRHVTEDLPKISRPDLASDVNPERTGVHRTANE